jgi:hypothetical protein
MILFGSFIVHILIVMMVFILMNAGILKIDSPMLVMVICIPFFGFFCAVVITILTNMGKVGTKGEELEIMKGNPGGAQDIIVQAAESDHIVPLEDALIMDDPTVRRSVMLDVLMSDAKGYMPVINQARMNDDVEVVHYATTAMVELSKEYELKLQEYSAAYAENPRKEGLLDEYIDFLQQYIGSGMIQGQLLEIQRNTYQQLLTTKVSLNPSMDDYERLVRNYFASGQFIKADVALTTMEQYWPEDERNWLLRFRYYVETGASAKVREMIEHVRTSGDYYSREIRDVAEFWSGDERRTPA